MAILLAMGSVLLAPSPARAEGLLGSILPPEPYESAGLEPDEADWDAPEPARAVVPDSVTLVLTTPDTAPRSPVVSSTGHVSRTLLVVRGLEKIGEFMPLVQGPAEIIRRYYDATHTNRYSLDLSANPVRDDYRMAVKFKF